MPANSDSQPNIDVNTPYTPKRPTPIISISVNHPLAQIARKIKNFLIHKQTLFSTTFTIKITPIVAMVSLMGVTLLFGGGVTTAYNWGKSVGEKFLSMQILSSPTTTPAIQPLSPTPAFVVLSRVGVVKATYQPQPTTTQAPIITEPTLTTQEGSTSSQKSTITPTITFTPTPTPSPSRYILATSATTVAFLVVPNSINLNNFLNKRVLATGVFNASKNTLTISQPTDLELLGI
jgi:hypothetical protein